MTSQSIAGEWYHNRRILQKICGVIVWTRVMLKLPKPVLLRVVLWLYLQAKVTIQMLITFKETKYFLEVLVKLRRPL